MYTKGTCIVPHIVITLKLNTPCKSGRKADKTGRRGERERERETERERENREEEEKGREKKKV